MHEKITTLGEFPTYAGFLFHDVEPDTRLLDRGVLAEAAATLEPLEPFEAPQVETALRALAERLGTSPRKAFEPIRVAVTGSKVSPGLFESLELLGRTETLRRLRTAGAEAA